MSWLNGGVMNCH